MEIYSENLETTVKIPDDTYAVVLDNLVNRLYYEDDYLEDFLCFSRNLYCESSSPFKFKYRPDEFLIKITRLLDYIQPSEVIGLRAHDIFTLLDSDDVRKDFENIGS